MIANAVLMLSVMTFVIAVSDLVLTDAQKKKLDTVFVKGWSWIDELKSKQSSLARRTGMRLLDWGKGILALAAMVLLTVLLDALFLPFSILFVGFKNAGVSLLSGFLVVGVFLSPLILIAGAFFSVYLISGIMWMIEFLTRRVAEQPKGPVLGTSILLGAAMTMLKSLG